ncbi:MAG: UbiH/UbiF/VisC/COQ6 family ubiquinone biosynthesis hydroxylase [Pseudomonadota bacterium]|nr:UbiH/UbiF/VisC/COQ6 family ubiquinone biosynthesis hydroxylase [Pseudomonadota bacterium]
MSTHRGTPGSRDFDVLIVGAGVVGAAMASLLVARKLNTSDRVAIISDRLPPAVRADADWDLRVYALSRAAERLLKICGVWSALPPNRVFAYERMCVWDAGVEPGAKGSLKFDSAMIGEPNLGFIVDGGALQRECLQAARNAGVAVLEAGLAAVAVGNADVSVRLTDGRELRCKLLIAADGTESKTRTLLGIETAGHAYHQDALVAHVRTAKPHADTAWQRFLSTGPLAFLPLPDGRSSMVWSVTLPEARRLRALDPAEFGRALTEASGGVLGECELTTVIAGFALKMQYAMQYARPRAVLLGDAAHVVHPLAGQGLNLGLLDCAALADVLGQASGGYFGEHKLLRRYERWRRSENLLNAAALDGLERLFGSAGALSTQLRTAGLAAVDSLPFAKRELARRALGLSGDIPAFLKVDQF